MPDSSKKLLVKNKISKTEIWEETVSEKVIPTKVLFPGIPWEIKGNENQQAITNSCPFDSEHTFHSIGKHTPLLHPCKNLD